MRISARLTRRGVVFAVIVTALVLGGGFAYATIPSSDGVISGCWNKRTGVLRAIDREAGVTCLAAENALDWNQVGPQGPPGPQGPQGPAGIVNAYFAGSRTHVDIPTVFTPILALDLPGGTWYVEGTVQLVNFSGQRVPVLCSLSGGATHTTNSTAQLPSYPEGGFDISLPVSGVVSLDAAGRVEIQCVSNTGDPAVTAFTEGRHMTALSVANVTIQQDPDQ
jgi:hypothetical protein